MMLSRILLLCCFGLSTAISAANSAVEPENELSQTVPPRVMTVALANNIKPYQFVQDGQAQGFVVDWWRLWGTVNGYEIEFNMATWSESIDLVTRGDADLHGGIQRLASREQQLQFSKPIINIQSQLFLTNDVVSTQLIQSLYPYVVGVIKGSAMIDMITQQYPLLTISVFDNRQQLINAVKAGNIKVVAGIAASALSSSEMTALFPQNKRIDLFNHPISVATSKQTRFLIDIVERGRANMSDAALRALALKWFSSRQNNAKLILATPLHYAPIAAISPEGKPYGYLIDLWDLWAKKNNTLIDFMPSYRTAILDNVRGGLADLTLSYPEHQMTNGLVKGRKMASIEVELFYYTDKFQRLTSGDLAGRKVGYDSAVFGDQNIAKLKQLFPNTQFLPLKSIYELINAVRGGDVAAVVMTELFAKSTFSNLNLSHQFKRVKDFSFQLDVFLWANGKVAPALTEISQGFDLISEAEINQLKQ
ncbi:MAG: transporter substrate-binding domain-containing protein, partial [Gammaproteobacteria bacterium]|nr:transporter substrate-binding domain-containing protein [Gammaproteobacteria bacterium]